MSKSKVSVDQIMDACERDDNSGFCLACGEEVYGAQELLMMTVA